MAIIHVDGKQYEVDGADNLLHACLSLGLDIPYFCWHPALGSVGACRQCAVKQYANADDKRGRLVMSCMTPSTDNSWISIEDEEAKSFRKSVVEWLMINHPHDCPVCEEGGHCHLQDMTVMAGQVTRRYRFTKRTHKNQDLGSFVNHEMNRCIACYRCVRYYKDYAVGERVLRQPGRGLPHRRLHRPHPLRPLQPQVGHAVRAERLPAVRGGLQHQPG
jgi:NADH-quinone oxidoreductase subunit G